MHKITNAKFWGLAAALVLMIDLAALPARAQTPPKEDPIIATIKAFMTTHDRAILDKMVGETFQGISYDGSVLDKKIMLDQGGGKEIPGFKRSYEQFVIRDYNQGSVKVVMFLLTYTKESARKVFKDELWMTQVWAFQDGNWQIDALQITRVI